MRKANITRKTKETDVAVSLNLDGNGKVEVSTGIGFLDHMLELLGYHSGFDLSIQCKGDLQVDGHHTAEDIAIALGDAFKKALGDCKGIERYACAFIPMDECLARVVIDISGRAYLAFNAELKGACGEFESELVEEFWRAFTMHCGITMHIALLASGNLHHEIEAIFKAVAHALKSAVKVTGDKIPSTKGIL